MNKTIICIYGRKNEGKTQTILNTCQLLRSENPNSILQPAEADFSRDIHCTLEIGNRIIGFNSQGDPVGRQRWIDLEDLANQNCDIIVCASRTRGQTVHAVDEIANAHGYETLWISSFYSPQLNTMALNISAAENACRIVRSSL